MALPEVTYAYYASTWRGRMSETDFSTALPHAAAAVSELTWPNVCESTTEDACRRAICAACDVDAAHGLSGGVGDVGGASIGSFSYSLTADAGAAGYDTEMRRAVVRELVGTGLLCRVVL